MSTESHVGVHWCSLDPAACLGMQSREQRPRLIAGIKANIERHEKMAERERQRLRDIEAADDPS